MDTSGVCMSNEFPGKPSFMLMQVKLFVNRWILLRIPGLGYQIVSQTEMMFELRLSSLATLVGRLYIWSYLWYADSVETHHYAVHYGPLLYVRCNVRRCSPLLQLSPHTWARAESTTQSSR